MKESGKMADLTKIYFRLQQVEDNYPPTPWESMWGRHLEDDIFEIDNIPFYVLDLSPGDRVRAVLVNGRYEYVETLFRSGNSVFRVYVYDESKTAAARNSFRALGVQSELAEAKMFAIEIPANANIEPILDLLMEGQDTEEWDFEEASLRHLLPD